MQALSLLTGKHQPVIYYLTNEGASDIVKIGTTVNMTQRFNRIVRTQQPSLIPTLLAYESGDLTGEYQRHRQFAHYRLQGEWFWLRGELLNHVNFLNGRRLSALPSAGVAL